MKQETGKLLYSSSDMTNLLGHFIIYPKEILDKVKYKLSTEDFNRPYNMIFGAIENIAGKGAEKITEENLLEEIRRYPNGYTAFQNALGENIVHILFQMTENDPSIVEASYERVKKYTALRLLKQNGFPVDGYFVTDFLNEDNINKKIDDTTIPKIIAPLRQTLDDIEEGNTNHNDTCKSAAEGLDEMVERLKDRPDIGCNLDGGILNYLVRGARQGKMYLYSAPSGGGKTRTMLSNACKLALPYLDDNMIEQDSKNPEDSPKILFIATEMDHEEIQRLVLAYVSGVDSETINDGAFPDDIRRRLTKAIEIIKKFKNNFLIEYLPDPNIAAIRGLINRHIAQDDVEYIFYDYIFTSPSLVSEFSGSRIREDVGLMMLSNTLKEIATTNGVFIMSATQVSGEWEGTKFRNMNYIRGSKAVADKTDIGMIGIRLNGEEKTRIDDVIDNYNKTASIENKIMVRPNIVVDIYKNRSGRAVEVKLFRKFDYGTCHTQDLFVTDADYNILEEYHKEMKEHGTN